MSPSFSIGHSYPISQTVQENMLRKITKWLLTCPMNPNIWSNGDLTPAPLPRVALFGQTARKVERKDWTDAGNTPGEGVLLTPDGRPRYELFKVAAALLDALLDPVDMLLYVLSNGLGEDRRFFSGTNGVTRIIALISFYQNQRKEVPIPIGFLPRIDFEAVCPGCSEYI